jgi:predicted O-linked N-acetylglucosamine transferase (SPINDLY family)
VLLYELLTGLTPIDAQRLAQASISEMMRLIQDEEPYRPSKRLSGAKALSSLARERVAFVAHQPRPLYLRQYHDIDISLDTFPVNGHTTSLDSFWMGVPVVTLVGPTALGRAGLCQSMNLGLPELIAHTPDDYVQIAVELAADVPRLGKLRATLRQRLRDSPLMNGPRFARNIESAYRSMWKLWCGTKEID